MMKRHKKEEAMSFFCEMLLSYVVKRCGARETVKWIIGEYIPGSHLSKNPKKRIADEVTETRIDA
jgi:hypothetical protein